jgi:peroxiredoxin
VAEQRESEDRDSGAEPATSLAQDPSENQGRIGYGRLTGKYTPLALAIILIVTLVAIGIYQQRDDPVPANDIKVGSPAPDFTQTDFNGNTFSLAEQTGKVVLVNFWSSDCAPCVRESPMLQAKAASDPDGLTIIGVDRKVDSDYPARRFAEEYGITYPLVADEGPGSTDTRGPIELAYGIAQYYPTTIFISPNGTIVSFKIGELSEKELNERIEEARNYQG